LLEVAVFYLERIPAAPLERSVRMLWYAQVPNTVTRRERVLPNGCVQVILNLARDFLLDCPEGLSDRCTPPTLIVGARSVYEIIDSSDIADLIGIVFEPGGFAAFAHDAVNLFSNRSVPLADIWGASAQALRTQLLELPSPRERLRCLERFLIGRVAGQPSRNRMVEFALDRFQNGPRMATVREVAKSTGWSERYFSQIFREEVGLSPKTWCRIQRFQRAVRQLHAGADVRWAELALDCGYYDQSHFANEFRAFSGIDATTYSAGRTRWANHIAVE
jgi:AraC-like DNA-binding protein